MKKVSLLLFLVSVSFIIYLFGFISHSAKIFPYQTLLDAQSAFDSIVKDLEGVDAAVGIDFWEKPGVEGAVSIRLSAKAGNEYVFILGDKNSHLDLCPENGCLGWVMDRNGKVLHTWKDTPDLWRPLQGHDTLTDKWSAYPVGAYVYPNGDLLVSYQGNRVFPIAMGLAKFDKDSNLLWKTNGYFHHWFSLDDKGRILIPIATIKESPYKIPQHDKTLLCKEQRFPVDAIAVVDPDTGEVLETIDLIQAFVQSDLVGLFNDIQKDQEIFETCDPLHLNDVQYIDARMAALYPQFDEGDLLLSFRSLNTVAVLDGKTKTFKWHYDGSMHRQHSPRLDGHGHVLVFDNLGWTIKKGKTRVASISVASHASTIHFPNAANEHKESFMSKTAGHIDVNRDADRYLVASTHMGLVYEIDLETGNILWEYKNTHKIGDKFARLPVYTALYLDKDQLTFLDGK